MRVEVFYGSYVLHRFLISSSPAKSDNSISLKRLSDSINIFEVTVFSSPVFGKKLLHSIRDSELSRNKRQSQSNISNKVGFIRYFLVAFLADGVLM